LTGLFEECYIGDFNEDFLHFLKGVLPIMQLTAMRIAFTWQPVSSFLIPFGIPKLNKGFFGVFERSIQDYLKNLEKI
jgi:hypothetical protein